MSTLEHKNIYVNRGQVRSDSALDFTAFGGAKRIRF